MTLISGGSRSGKSALALRLGEKVRGKGLFIATCPPLDAEMASRIARHKSSRDALKWDTSEEPLNPEKIIEECPNYAVYILDCLTLWLNNLLHEANQCGTVFSEDQAVAVCRRLAMACAKVKGQIIIVTNEVGMGIVPENPAARAFRDLSGRANQTLGEAAREVILTVCGQPLWLKGKFHDSKHNRPY